MCIEGGNDLDGIDDAFEVTGLEWKVGGGCQDQWNQRHRFLDWIGEREGKAEGGGGPEGRGGGWCRVISLEVGSYHFAQHWDTYTPRSTQKKNTIRLEEFGWHGHL